MGERILTSTGQFSSPEEILGLQRIGGKVASEWIRRKLRKYAEEYELQLFEIQTGKFEIFEISADSERKTIVAERAIGEEAVRFTAGFERGELNFVAVVLDFEGVVDWVIRGKRGEKRQKMEFAETDNKKLLLEEVYASE